VPGGGRGWRAVGWVSMSGLHENPFTPHTHAVPHPTSHTAKAMQVIWDNDQLTSLAGLGPVTELFSRLWVDTNNRLRNLTGLDVKLCGWFGGMQWLQ